MIKGCGCRIIIDQTPQEPEKNLVVVPPTVRIVHMDRVQTYEEDPSPTRPRAPLANWTSVNLGSNPKRPTVDEITKHQLQWHIFANDNTDYRPGQGCNNYDNKPSDERQHAEGDLIYSGEDGSTPGQGLEDVD